MFKILKLNEIDNIINKVFKKNYEVSKDFTDYDAIIVRSYKIHDLNLSKNLLCVGRAGAGTNNIPVSELREKGICVFNAPGANSNAVKELVIAALINSSRNFVKASKWCETLDKTLNKDLYNKEVENGKKIFSGCEIDKKTLGVIGLGNIGRLVANSAKDLGMKVIGNDARENLPFTLPKKIKRVYSLEEIYKNSDYITLHVPLCDSTENLINKESISKMKDGVIILNYSRGEIVNTNDIIEAVKSGKVAKYYCDFPSVENQNIENIICTPHLGASTEEAETICAKMASEQIKEYLENGNIINSVNMPNINVERKLNRITIFSKEEDNIINYIVNIINENNISINNISQSTQDKYIYLIIDTESNFSEKFIEILKNDKKFIKVRFINK